MNSNPTFPGTHHSFVIEKLQAGQRIDKFLTQALPTYSRSFFQGLIDQGHVTINKSQPKSSTVLKESDIVALAIPLEQKAPLFCPVTSDLGIEVVARHEHFFIINKPAGLLVHKTESPTADPTVVDWLLSSHAELVQIGNPERPGIVHRLDKDTSGLLIIARTNYAHMIFGNMFKKRTISKTYLALVQGHPPASGTIDLSIGRDPSCRKKMKTFIPDNTTLATTAPFEQRSHKSRRNAITHYTVKHYFDTCSLVEVRPVTGRTHQIRVHFAALGFPLVGDYLYGTPSKLIDRHALHAACLSFDFQGTPFNFTQEVPDDFKKLIQFFHKS